MQTITAEIGRLQIVQKEKSQFANEESESENEREGEREARRKSIALLFSYFVSRHSNSKLLIAVRISPGSVLLLQRRIASM